MMTMIVVVPLGKEKVVAITTGAKEVKVVIIIAIMAMAMGKGRDPVVKVQKATTKITMMSLIMDQNTVVKNQKRVVKVIKV